MGYSDMPFSITSKFSVQGGPEHLVTIRATNAADMKARLEEAAQIFPYAGLLQWLETGQGNVKQEPAVSEPPDDDPVPVPNPVRATEAKATANAHARSAAASAAKKDNGRNCDLPNGQTPFEPRCPQHGRAAKSRFGSFGALYCPTQLEDGSYCKWSWTPAPAHANVN